MAVDELRVICDALRTNLKTEAIENAKQLILIDSLN